MDDLSLKAAKLVIECCLKILEEAEAKLQGKPSLALLKTALDLHAVEPTQDAAIEKARKLESDAAIHVERVRNVDGGGRDKWRRI